MPKRAKDRWMGAEVPKCRRWTNAEVHFSKSEIEFSGSWRTSRSDRRTVVADLSRLRSWVPLQAKRIGFDGNKCRRDSRDSSAAKIEEGKAPDATVKRAKLPG